MMKKIFMVGRKFIKSPQKKQLLLGFGLSFFCGGLKGSIKFIRELEKRKQDLAAMDLSRPIKLDGLFTELLIKNKLDLSVDIVIPVYDGYEYLQALFTSLFLNTTSAHRIIVVNDCSPDVRVAEFLRSVTKYKNQYCKEIIVIHNPENLGFVQTVNTSLTYLQNNFVILNTDVEVPNGWLERLMMPFENNSNIASTTPFTNSGTICSFPVWLEDNKLPFGLDCDAVDNVFHHVNLANIQQEMPTGVGFCMGMNKSLVDRIGLFDAETFGKGYCEENDWCQRAIAIGYKNIHVTNLFVYHKHGGSFGDTKLQLIKNNFQKLLHKHPFYQKDVSAYIGLNKLRDLRLAITLRLATQQNNAVLIFDHGIGGGASKYLEENILPLEAVAILISGFYDSRNVLIKLYHYNVLIVQMRLTSLEDFSSNFVGNKVFTHIYLNHTLTIANLTVLKSLLKNNAEHVSYYTHDFLSICPSYTLLDNYGKYCGTEVDIQKCSSCQVNHKFQRRNSQQFIDMKTWREDYAEILNLSDEVFCFSNDSKNHLVKIYPSIKDNIIVKPHVIKTQLSKISERIEFQNNEVITVAALGAIDYQKGRAVLQNLAKKPLFKNKQFKLLLIGYADVTSIKNCQITGVYTANDLPEIIKSNKVDIFIIPSIWPETFCYTAEEIMAMGFPLICFNIGAPAERILNYEHGYICKSLDVNGLYQVIIEVATKYFFKIHR